MKPIEVKFDRKDVLLNYQYENGNVFYLGYENNPTRQVSVLFPNLDWLKKTFGEDLNINDGRKNEIEILTFCLKHNIPRWEYNNIVNITTIPVDGVYKRLSEKRMIVDGEYIYPIIEYRPCKLSDGGRKQFKDNIANGLLVLCRMV